MKVFRFIIKEVNIKEFYYLLKNVSELVYIAMAQLNIIAHFVKPIDF